MPARTRHYRKKPGAVFEHGTRIYAPTANEPRYRVVAADAGGARLFHKFADEDDARAKARELEAYLADRTPSRSSPDAPRTVAARATSSTWVGARCATENARRRCCAAGCSPTWATWR